MNNIVLSVHGLVDFVLRTGDIDTRVFNLETMTRGSQLHAYYQAKQNERYLAEQFLEYVFPYEEFSVQLQGRVDGIIINDSDVTIEEIKTTNSDIDLFFLNHEKWHLGQAECYALMYLLVNGGTTISVQLTYISQIDERKTIKRYAYTLAALKEKINEYFAHYFAFYRQVLGHVIKRNKEVAKLQFPFSDIRQSQQIMMDEVSEGLKTNTKMYFNAPTGSGKTMAALYPSVKYLSRASRLKIFYLTAKGSGKLQAENALKRLNNQAQIKSITLSAKEKMCLNDKVACNPLECPFAVNYYGKLRSALFDIFTHENQFSYDTIMNYAKKHELCPFEFQLDLSLYCDVIIADYNYLFDPFVYLRRFFDTKSSEYIALIDEAHNLPRRVMDNYTKTLDFTPFYSFRKLLKGPAHKSVRLIINKIVRYLQEYSAGISEEFEALNEFPLPLLVLLEKFLTTASTYMQNEAEAQVEGFSDFFFSVNKFLKLLSLFSTDFVLYSEIDNEHKFFPKFTIKCLNSARFISEALKLVEHPVFFSATLSPAPYFKTLLDIKSDITNVPNPFNKDQLLLMVDSSVSLFFKDRDKTLDEVVAKIIAVTKMKTGNYLVYAPSFSYLAQLEAKLMSAGFYNLVVQNQFMSDSAKAEYLDMFTLNPVETQIGLAVLGGSFSEGVDLVSDRLSGVIILGVGYPPPSFEKDLEEQYFDKLLADGNTYAYIYPAINKILQTMGRVIRTENDRGFVLLIDKRYSYEPYRTYLNDYSAYKVNVRSVNDIYSVFNDYPL